MIDDAIHEYLMVYQWQIKEIEKGIKQANTGNLVPHEVIRKKWETKLAKLNPRQAKRRKIFDDLKT